MHLFQGTEQDELAFQSGDTLKVRLRVDSYEYLTSH